MNQTRFKLTIAVVLAAACSGKGPVPADTQSAASVTPPPATGGVASGDSLRGMIALRGKDSVPDLVLQTSADTVVLRGADVETLRRIVGFEVVVRGARAATNFDVAGFVVRAVNGERVTDGILDVANGVFFVRTEDGARADISNLPSPLRGEIGSRVYLVGPLDRLPTAFGVITEAR